MTYDRMVGERYDGVSNDAFDDDLEDDFENWTQWFFEVALIPLCLVALSSVMLMVATAALYGTLWIAMQIPALNA